MTAKNLARVLLAALSLSLGMMARAAGDPTVDQVYQAAHSGHYEQAQSMMRQVLRDHPNSAKAHFVEAELLAGHGDLASARAELGRARGLNAGLSFAKPEAVRSLESRLAATASTRARSASPTWMWLLGVLALIAVWVGVRSSLRRRAWGPGDPGMTAGGPASGPVGPGGPMGPRPGQGVYGAGYGQGMPGASGGMGSGILGGLATGAAMGAGFAAGEALIDRALGNHQGAIAAGAIAPTPVAGSTTGPSAPAYDMGGDDFGLQDPGSWDTASDASAGADDWGADSGGDAWDSVGDDSNDWT
ncbi:tetratricopeptide repeat protein [Candidimonas humi]|uniref:Tetratricopeptide repeat protein n=1 Tax=Candidimonas humi TaxID=683355 RepID=A0ABV8NW12_9BURK|nr:tetratricopeptide repeat protein [Candidimonas humi]MBV6305067.1 tetratricopeptide repeat protein [Candidimonas humi]